MIKFLLVLTLVLTPVGNVYAQAFPSTSIQDTFTRADGDITTGSSWVLWPLINGNASVLSNQIGHVTTTNVGNLYNVTYGPDMECYIKVTTLPADGEDWDIGFRHDPNPNTDTWYGLKHTKVAGSSNDTLLFFKGVAGVYNDVGTAHTLGTDLATNDILGVRVQGTTMRAFINNTEIFSRTDGDISGAGLCGVIIKNNTLRLDDFGGGTFSASSSGCKGGSLRGMFGC